MNINDPTNLTHLSDLVNQYTVNKNLDLEAIEKDMIGVTVRRQPDVDPTDAFRSAMDELRQDVGITIDANMSFMDDKPGIGNGSTTTRREPTRMMSNSRSTIATTTRNQPARSRDVIEELDEIGEAETMSVSKTKPGHYDEEITNQDDFLTTLQREYSTNGGDQPDQIYTDNPQTRTRTMGPPLRQPSPPRQPGYQNTTQSYGYDTQPGYQNYGTQSGYQGYSQNQSGYQNDQGNQYYDPNRYDANNYGQGNGYPQDDRQAQLNNVMQNYGGHIDELSYKKEQEEDTKSILLEDIDEIRMELEDDNVDLSRVPEVNQDSSLVDVQKVHKTVRAKYIKRRYMSMGHEIILAGAQGLGYIFDGERKIGPYKPNLNGWHNEVRTKLRRMKYETATIVSNIVQEYNIGPVSRLLFELVPSAVIFSHMKATNVGKPGYNVDAVSNAISELREST
jgi:hypothetical protein